MQKKKLRILKLKLPIQRHLLTSARMRERLIVAVQFVCLCIADLECRCITTVETGTNVKKMMIQVLLMCHF